jgi:hypothetical protein
MIFQMEKIKVSDYITVQIGDGDSFYREDLEDYIVAFLHTLNHTSNDKLISIAINGMDHDELYNTEEAVGYVFAFAYAISVAGVSFDIFSEETKTLINNCYQIHFDNPDPLTELVSFADAVELQYLKTGIGLN